MATSKTPPGRNGYKYKARFGLVVTCSDEQTQQEQYKRLKALGYKVRVVCV
jgi:hypothetical protein